MSLLGLMRSLAALVIAFAILLGLEARAHDDYIDPASGYRMSHYRAAVPDTVPSGTRLRTEEVEKLFKVGKVSFIDVLPSTGAGFDPKTGQWRLSVKHKNIPGSIWLPDVGRGEPGADLERYFAENLSAITGGDKTRAILIYCKADCWMSWNAVKRAASYGYSNIYWYADGIDGWAEWDNPTAPAEPVPVRVGDKTQ